MIHVTKLQWILLHMCCTCIAGIIMHLGHVPVILNYSEARYSFTLALTTSILHQFQRQDPDR